MTPTPSEAHRVSRPRTDKALLIFTQVFVPDPAAVGQQIADAAVEMARRGHRVRVYTSARGYDDPTARYPAREDLHGVDVRRLPLASFGKRSILTRLVGTVAFMAQVLFIGLFARNVGGILFSTSPPMIGLIATIVARLRGLPTAYWAMDLNPDQLIALGKVRPDAPLTRLVERVNRFILRNATLVVALDRFMAARLEARMPLAHKMLVLPPWPHEEQINDAADEDMTGTGAAPNPFREGHGLGDRFVFMYSGNHSPSNPLRTLLEAAERFRDRDNVRFLFVGGGVGKAEVEAFIRERRLTNAASLPYQPFAELRHSLAAADVQVVSLGAEMVGIIHPCKVYGAMAAARPVLFLGPKPSHVSDLLNAHGIGWQIAHGDVEGAAETIRSILETPRERLYEMGTRARVELRRYLSQRSLCGRLCDELERRLRLTRPARSESAESDGREVAAARPAD